MHETFTVRREFGEDAKRNAGYQLDRVQRGGEPSDFKPMPTVGRGVKEIRMWTRRDLARDVYGSVGWGSVCASCVSKEDTSDFETRY